MPAVHETGSIAERARRIRLRALDEGHTVKKWSGALLPLGILLVLLALTAWLRYATESPEPDRNGKHRHDPDFIITDARGHKLDGAGKLLYTLVTTELRHYPDDDSSELLNPQLVYLQPGRPAVSISAGHGLASSRAQRIDLREAVELRRAASAGDQELVVETDQLTLLPDEEKAFTLSQVRITQGKSWLQGVGMQVDHKRQTYVLESRVNGEIESHFARKTPKP
ncbi:MAG: LPS export ABC transporter periplasmic protein LptC [Candidatus Accumulibacter sp. UW26]|jgi:lipopolysaccharide export system protein LptC